MPPLQWSCACVKCNNILDEFLKSEQTSIARNAWLIVNRKGKEKEDNSDCGEKDENDRKVALDVHIA